MPTSWVCVCVEVWCFQWLSLSLIWCGPFQVVHITNIKMIYLCECQPAEYVFVLKCDGSSINCFQWFSLSLIWCGTFQVVHITNIKMIYLCECQPFNQPTNWPTVCVCVAGRRCSTTATSCRRSCTCCRCSSATASCSSSWRTTPGSAWPSSSGPAQATLYSAGSVPWSSTSTNTAISTPSHSHWGFGSLVVLINGTVCIYLMNRHLFNQQSKMTLFYWLWWLSKQYILWERTVINTWWTDKLLNC